MVRGAESLFLYLFVTLSATPVGLFWCSVLVWYNIYPCVWCTNKLNNKIRDISCCDIVFNDIFNKWKAHGSTNTWPSLSIDMAILNFEIFSNIIQISLKIYFCQKMQKMLDTKKYVFWVKLLCWNRKIRLKWCMNLFFVVKTKNLICLKISEKTQNYHFHPEHRSAHHFNHVFMFQHKK